MIAHIPVNFKHKIPKLYAQQHNSTDIVYATYYIQGSDWRWHIFESSRMQNLFYGYVEPECTYQYFTIEQLQKITYELDNSFEPKPLKEVL